MSDIIIHHISISYDESHQRVKDFIEYLKDEKRTDELKAYYEEAKKSHDYKMHINDKYGNEFTLEYVGIDKCKLRLRGM